LSPTRSVVNLCFHGIGTPTRPLEPGEDRYWVGTDQFDRLLDEAMTHPDVRLSVDDGNASDVELALPRLLERGLTATFFLLAARIGTSGSVDADGVRALRDAGMTIGSHGMDHRSWRGMAPDVERVELALAARQLTELAGQPVTQAACPLGRYDRRSLRALRRHGYTRVFTSDRRRARPDGWLQPRFSALRDDTAGTLRQTVTSHGGGPRARTRGVAQLLKRFR
jgi:peptidoglycan/xylan/chitin deacetylase (PgdA/CDA1 family)